MQLATRNAPPAGASSGSAGSAQSDQSRQVGGPQRSGDSSSIGGEGQVAQLETDLQKGLEEANKVQGQPEEPAAIESLRSTYKNAGEKIKEVNPALLAQVKEKIGEGQQGQQSQGAGQNQGPGGGSPQSGGAQPGGGGGKPCGAGGPNDAQKGGGCPNGQCNPQGDFDAKLKEALDRVLGKGAADKIKKEMEEKNKAKDQTGDGQPATKPENQPKVESKTPTQPAETTTTPPKEGEPGFVGPVQPPAAQVPVTPPTQVTPPAPITSAPSAPSFTPAVTDTAASWTPS
jgi:hypothetical protein